MCHSEVLLSQVPSPRSTSLRAQGLPFPISPWHQTCDHGLVDGGSGCSEVGGLRGWGLHLIESVGAVYVIRAKLFGQLPQKEAPHNREKGVFRSQEEGAGVGAIEVSPTAHLGNIDLREHPSWGCGANSPDIYWRLTQYSSSAS